MKNLLNYFDSELRAIAHGQMELWRKLLDQKCYTKNEEKIKVVLNERLCKVIDAVTSLQAVITRLKEMEEFELLHVIDVDELLDKD